MKDLLKIFPFLTLLKSNDNYFIKNDYYNNIIYHYPIKNKWSIPFNNVNYKINGFKEELYYLFIIN